MAEADRLYNALPRSSRDELYRKVDGSIREVTSEFNPYLDIDDNGKWFYLATTNTANLASLDPLSEIFEKLQEAHPSLTDETINKVASVYITEIKEILSSLSPPPISPPPSPLHRYISGAINVGPLKMIKACQDGKNILKLKLGFDTISLEGENSIRMEDFKDGDKLVVLDRMMDYNSKTGDWKSARKGFNYIFKEDTINQWFTTKANRGEPLTNPLTGGTVLPTNIEIFTVEISGEGCSSTAGGASYKKRKYPITRKKHPKRRKTRRGKNKRIRLSRYF